LRAISRAAAALIADAEIVAEHTCAAAHNRTHSGIAAQCIGNDCAASSTREPALRVVFQTGAKANQSDDCNDPSFFKHVELPSLKQNCFAATVSYLLASGAKGFFKFWPQSADPAFATDLKRQSP
jgi:hypothetical protein